MLPTIQLMSARIHNSENLLLQALWAAVSKYNTIRRAPTQRRPR
jgi:hypothetical protein